MFDEENINIFKAGFNYDPTISILKDYNEDYNDSKSTIPLGRV